LTTIVANHCSRPDAENSANFGAVSSKRLNFEDVEIFLKHI